MNRVDVKIKNFFIWSWDTIFIVAFYVFLWLTQLKSCEKGYDTIS